MTWALRVPVGGNQKVVLIGLANHAHPDGTEAYPSLDTLAEYAHCDRSTARRNVRKLVADGWAIEDGLGPRGQVKYRLPLERQGGKTPPVAPPPSGGGKNEAEGVAPVLPEPSLGTDEPSTTSSAHASPDDQVPDDFPEALRPHARAAMRVLLDLAERKQAKRPTARSLGLVMMARPTHPLVRAAHDYAAWADAPSKRPRDVVAGYRNWLDRCDPLASTEPLPGAAPPADPANVTRLRSSGSRATDARMERQAERFARAQAAGGTVGGVPDTDRRAIE